jgi:hypothetical protein
MRVPTIVKVVAGTSAALALASGTVTQASAGTAPTQAGSASCVYEATQVAGRAGTQGAGLLEDTDGDTRFVGWTSGEGPQDTYPHGTLWHNGSVVRDNGALEGVIAVNRAGDTLDIDGNSHAVTPNGGVPTSLKWPASSQWYRGIRNLSDDGLIIGQVQYTDNTRHALLWSVSTAGTTVRDLGVIGSGYKGELADIADTGGQFVGTSETGNLKKAITGTPSTRLSPLGGVDSRVESTATDIAGRFILGTGTLQGTQTQSVLLWENGVPRSVPAPGTATDVNADGVVVGWPSFGGVERAYTVRGTTRTTLPAPAEFPNARAHAVTADGRVLGYAWADPTDPDSNRRTAPVVWTCR